MYEALLSLLLVVPLCLGTTSTGWVEVFRAGQYPQGDWTPEEVQAVADNYDRGFFESPATTDHRQQGPAYGWVEDVKAEAGKLFVKFREVADGFADAINEGLFKNRSVELFRDLDGKGPYLKAVSFLGAKAPQVKGLEPIEEFSLSAEHLAADSDAFSFTPEADSDHEEMGAMGDRLEELMMDRDMSYAELAEAMSGDGARDESTLQSIVNGEIETPPDEVLESLAGVFDGVSPEDLGQLRAEDGGAAYSHEEAGADEEELGDLADVDTMAEMKQTVAQMQAELQSERQRRRQAEERAEEAEDDLHNEAFEQFMEERVPPAVRPRARAIYKALQDASGHVEFADAAGEEVEDDPARAFEGLLKAFDQDLFEELADEPPSDEEFSNDTSSFTDAVREDMRSRGAL